MKTALLLSALLLTSLMPLQAAEFEKGTWTYVSTQAGDVIVGGNFHVSKSGRMSGKAFYYNGFQVRLSGKINEIGVFTLSEKGKDHGFTLTGKISRSGDSFRLKIADSDRLILGEKVSDNFKEAGAYVDEESSGGHFIGFVITPAKKAVGFLSDGTNFVRMKGIFKAGKVFVDFGDYNAEGKAGRVQIVGKGAIGQTLYTFKARRL